MKLTDLAKEFHIGEINDYRLYTELAVRVKDPELRKEIERIANMEKGHAKFRHEFLGRRGEEVPSEKRKFFQSFVLFLSRFINPLLLVSLLELGESSAYTQYYRFVKERSDELSKEEVRALKEIILDELSHESTFREKLEGMGLSNIRDLVLGMNDGLVELLGVVAGLSAVYGNEPIVVGASAVVVGMAGAISMGVGAFISVRSQRQVNEAIRKREIILADITGKKISERSDSSEDEIRSALFTGLSYLLGVVFPVSPYFLVKDSITGLYFSLSLAVLTLALVGGFIALLSGISLRKKVLEMVLSAGFAAGASFLFGSLVKRLLRLEV